MKFGYENLEVCNKAVDFDVRDIETVENISTDRKHYRLLDFFELSALTFQLSALTFGLSALTFNL